MLNSFIGQEYSRELKETIREGIKNLIVKEKSEEKGIDKIESNLEVKTDGEKCVITDISAVITLSDKNNKVLYTYKTEGNNGQ
jgi:hypothetical protein